MLMIMAHHVYVMGFSGEYLFKLGWVWVEFFFILTGYYTAKHFDNYRQDDKDNLSKNIMIYNIKKFKSYFVLAIIAIVLQYFINLFVYHYDLKSIFIVFSKLPYEALFLTSFGVAPAELAPIWYLSAVFIILPLVAYLFVKWHDFWYILSWLVPLLYLGRFGVNTVRDWPNDLLRAFAYLMLGTFVYLMVKLIKNIEIKGLFRLMLTLVEVGSFFAVIILCAMNYDNNIIILLFTVATTIMLSEQSFTNKLNSTFADYLGKISLPMFLFHWGIGSVISIIVNNPRIQLVLYYLGTITIAIVITIIMDKIKNKQGE